MTIISSISELQTLLNKDAIVFFQKWVSIKTKEEKIDEIGKEDILNMPYNQLKALIEKGRLSYEEKTITEITSTGSVGGYYETAFPVSKRDLKTLENMKESKLFKAKQELITEYVYPSPAAKETAKNVKSGGKKEQTIKPVTTSSKTQTYTSKAAKQTTKNSKDSDSPKTPAKPVTGKKGEAHTSAASQTSQDYKKGSNPTSKATVKKDATEQKKDGPKVVQKAEKDKSFTPPKNKAMDNRKGKVGKGWINPTGLQHLEYDDASDDALEVMKKYLKAGDKSKNGLASNPNSTTGEDMIKGAAKIKNAEKQKPEVVSLGDDIELTGKNVEKKRPRVSDTKNKNTIKENYQKDGTYYYSSTNMNDNTFLEFSPSTNGWGDGRGIQIPESIKSNNDVTQLIAKIVQNGNGRNYNLTNLLKSKRTKLMPVTMDESNDMDMDEACDYKMESKTIKFKSFVFENVDQAINSIPAQYKKSNVLLEMIDAENNSLIVECKNNKVEVKSTFSKNVDVISEQITKFNPEKPTVKNSKQSETDFFKSFFNESRRPKQNNGLSVNDRLIVEGAQLGQSITDTLNTYYSRSEEEAQIGMKKYAQSVDMSIVDKATDGTYLYLKGEGDASVESPTIIYDIQNKKFYYMSLLDYTNDSNVYKDMDDYNQGYEDSYLGSTNAGNPIGGIAEEYNMNFGDEVHLTENESLDDVEVKKQNSGFTLRNEDLY